MNLFRAFRLVLISLFLWGVFGIQSFASDVDFLFTGTNIEKGNIVYLDHFSAANIVSETLQNSSETGPLQNTFNIDCQIGLDSSVSKVFITIDGLKRECNTTKSSINTYDFGAHSSTLNASIEFETPETQGTAYLTFSFADGGYTYESKLAIKQEVRFQGEDSAPNIFHLAESPLSLSTEMIKKPMSSATVLGDTITVQCKIDDSSSISSINIDGYICTKGNWLDVITNYNLSTHNGVLNISNIDFSQSNELGFAKTLFRFQSTDPYTYIAEAIIVRHGIEFTSSSPYHFNKALYNIQKGTTMNMRSTPIKTLTYINTEAGKYSWSSLPENTIIDISNNTDGRESDFITGDEDTLTNNIQISTDSSGSITIPFQYQQNVTTNSDTTELFHFNITSIDHNPIPFTLFSWGYLPAPVVHYGISNENTFDGYETSIDTTPSFNTTLYGHGDNYNQISYQYDVEYYNGSSWVNPWESVTTPIVNSSFWELNSPSNMFNINIGIPEIQVFGNNNKENYRFIVSSRDSLGRISQDTTFYFTQERNYPPRISVFSVENATTGVSLSNGESISPTDLNINFTLDDSNTGQKIGYQLEISNDSKFSDISSKFTEEAILEPGSYSVLLSQLTPQDYYIRMYPVDDAGRKGNIAPSSNGYFYINVEQSPPHGQFIKAIDYEDSQNTKDYIYSDTINSQSIFDPEPLFGFELEEVNPFLPNIQQPISGLVEAIVYEDKRCIFWDPERIIGECTIGDALTPSQTTFSVYQGTVNDTFLRGQLYSSDFGRIYLDKESTPLSMSNSFPSDWEYIENEKGILSGKAWSQAFGWVSFNGEDAIIDCDPFSRSLYNIDEDGAPDTNNNYRVCIKDGNFYGNAYIEHQMFHISELDNIFQGEGISYHEFFIPSFFDDYYIFNPRITESYINTYTYDDPDTSTYNPNELTISNSLKTSLLTLFQKKGGQLNFSKQLITDEIDYSDYSNFLVASGVDGVYSLKNDITADSINNNSTLSSAQKDILFALYQKSHITTTWRSDVYPVDLRIQAAGYNASEGSSIHIDGKTVASSVNMTNGENYMIVILKEDNDSGWTYSNSFLFDASSAADRESIETYFSNTTLVPSGSPVIIASFGNAKNGKNNLIELFENINIHSDLLKENDTEVFAMITKTGKTTPFFEQNAQGSSIIKYSYDHDSLAPSYATLSGTSISQHVGNISMTDGVRGVVTKITKSGYKIPVDIRFDGLKQNYNANAYVKIGNELPSTLKADTSMPHQVVYGITMDDSNDTWTTDLINKFYLSEGVDQAEAFNTWLENLPDNTPVIIVNNGNMAYNTDIYRQAFELYGGKSSTIDSINTQDTFIFISRKGAKAPYFEKVYTGTGGSAESRDLVYNSSENNKWGLIGQIWSSGGGYIQLDKDGIFGITSDDLNIDYGVYISDKNTHDGSMYLDGHAWSDTLGWFYFKGGTGRNNCSKITESNFDETNFQVCIDVDGNMHGYAWNDNFGWLSFEGIRMVDGSSTTGFELEVSNNAAFEHDLDAEKFKYTHRRNSVSNGEHLISTVEIMDGINKPHDPTHMFNCDQNPEECMLSYGNYYWKVKTVTPNGESNTTIGKELQIKQVPPNLENHVCRDDKIETLSSINLNPINFIEKNTIPLNTKYTLTVYKRILDAPRIKIENDVNGDNTLSPTEIAADTTNLNINIGLPTGISSSYLLSININGNLQTVAPTNTDINNQEYSLTTTIPNDGETMNISAYITSPDGKVSPMSTNNVTVGGSIAPQSPTILITEDTNNDGILRESEIDGDIDFQITLPTNTANGDTLKLNINGVVQDVLLTDNQPYNDSIAVTNIQKGETVNISSYIIYSNQSISPISHKSIFRPSETIDTTNITEVYSKSNLDITEIPIIENLPTKTNGSIVSYRITATNTSENIFGDTITAQSIKDCIGIKVDALEVELESPINGVTVNSDEKLNFEIKGNAYDLIDYEILFYSDALGNTPFTDQNGINIKIIEGGLNNSTNYLIETNIPSSLPTRETIYWKVIATTNSGSRKESIIESFQIQNIAPNITNAYWYDTSAFWTKNMTECTITSDTNPIFKFTATDDVVSSPATAILNIVNSQNQSSTYEHVITQNITLDENNTPEDQQIIFSISLDTDASLGTETMLDSNGNTIPTPVEIYNFTFLIQDEKELESNPITGCIIYDRNNGAAENRYGNIGTINIVAPTGHDPEEHRYSYSNNIGSMDWNPYYGGVHVGGTDLSGYAYDGNLSWIRFRCDALSNIFGSNDKMAQLRDTPDNNCPSISGTYIDVNTDNDILNEGLGDDYGVLLRRLDLTDPSDTTKSRIIEDITAGHIVGKAAYTYAGKVKDINDMNSFLYFDPYTYWLDYKSDTTKTAPKSLEEIINNWVTGKNFSDIDQSQPGAQIDANGRFFGYAYSPLYGYLSMRQYVIVTDSSENESIQEKSMAQDTLFPITENPPGYACQGSLSTQNIHHIEAYDTSSYPEVSDAAKILLAQNDSTDAGCGNPGFKICENPSVTTGTNIKIVRPDPTDTTNTIEHTIPAITAYNQNGYFVCEDDQTNKTRSLYVVLPKTLAQTAGSYAITGTIEQTHGSTLILDDTNQIDVNVYAQNEPKWGEGFSTIEKSKAYRIAINNKSDQNGDEFSLTINTKYGNTYTKTYQTTIANNGSRAYKIVEGLVGANPDRTSISRVTITPVIIPGANTSYIMVYENEPGIIDNITGSVTPHDNDNPPDAYIDIKSDAHLANGNDEVIYKVTLKDQFRNPIVNMSNKKTTTEKTGTSDLSDWINIQVKYGIEKDQITTSTDYTNSASSISINAALTEGNMNNLTGIKELKGDGNTTNEFTFAIKSLAPTDDGDNKIYINSIGTNITHRDDVVEQIDSSSSSSTNGNPTITQSNGILTTGTYSIDTNANFDPPITMGIQFAPGTVFDGDGDSSAEYDIVSLQIPGASNGSLGINSSNPLLTTMHCLDGENMRFKDMYIVDPDYEDIISINCFETTYDTKYIAGNNPDQTELFNISGVTPTIATTDFDTLFDSVDTGELHIATFHATVEKDGTEEMGDIVGSNFFVSYIKDGKTIAYKIINPIDDGNNTASVNVRSGYVEGISHGEQVYSTDVSNRDDGGFSQVSAVHTTKEMRAKIYKSLTDIAKEVGGESNLKELNKTEVILESSDINSWIQGNNNAFDELGDSTGRKGVNLLQGGKVLWIRKDRENTGGPMTVHIGNEAKPILDINASYEEQNTSRTIVIEGANVAIDTDIMRSNNGVLAIIVIQDYNDIGKAEYEKLYGNILIHPSVTNIRALLFADGSLFSYDDSLSYISPILGDNSNRATTLKNQLYIYGSIISQNTYGGSSNPEDGCNIGITSNSGTLNNIFEGKDVWHGVSIPKCTDYNQSSDYTNIENEAIKFDLKRLREFRTDTNGDSVGNKVYDSFFNITQDISIKSDDNDTRWRADKTTPRAKSSVIIEYDPYILRNPAPATEYSNELDFQQTIN